MKYLKYASGYALIIAFFSVIGWGFYELYAAGLSWALVTLIAVYSVNVVFTFFAFIQVRHTQAKLSWIVIMVFLPIFGHIIFIIFGQRYRDRKSIDKYRKNKNFEFEEKDSSALKAIDEDIRHIFEKQSVLSNRGIYDGNFEVFKSGDKGYESLFNDLENAKEFIHIQYYIIKTGEIYEHLKDILIRKVKQGVKVRFIIDDFGRWAMPWYELRELNKKGVEVVIFNKVHFPFIGSDNGYRTHRKMAIIDGKVVHTGGLNIANEYANLNKEYGLWIDLQARITGKAVRSFSLLFIEDWKHVTKEELDYSKYLNEDSTGTSKTILIEDSPECSQPVMMDSIVQMISNAKKEIKLASPYFVPTPEIMAALRTAALSGVKVELYIPGKPDKLSVFIATHLNSHILQSHGATIYEAKNMLIHSKIGVFDGKYAYLGSANLDTRSLYAQFEIINLVEGKVVSEIDDLFNYYKKLSRVVEKDEFKVHGVKGRMIRFYVNLFSPVL